MVYMLTFGVYLLMVNITIYIAYMDPSWVGNGKSHGCFGGSHPFSGQTSPRAEPSHLGAFDACTGAAGFTRLASGRV